MIGWGVLGLSKYSQARPGRGATACPGLKPGSSNWASHQPGPLTLGAAGMYWGLPFTPVLPRKGIFLAPHHQRANALGSEFKPLFYEELEWPSTNEQIRGPEGTVMVEIPSSGLSFPPGAEGSRGQAVRWIDSLVQWCFRPCCTPRGLPVIRVFELCHLCVPRTLHTQG